MLPVAVLVLASAGPQVTARDPALPRGALVRLGGPRFRFDGGGPGGFVAVSPDRRRAVGPAADGLAEYSTATGEPGTRYAAAAALAYSPDGRTLAALGREHHAPPVLLFDAATGKEIGRMPGRPAVEPEFCAFAAGGLFIAAGEGDDAFHVWDVRAGRETRTFPRTYQ